MYTYLCVCVCCLKYSTGTLRELEPACPHQRQHTSSLALSRYVLLGASPSTALQHAMHVCVVVARRRGLRQARGEACQADDMLAVMFVCAGRSFNIVCVR